MNLKQANIKSRGPEGTAGNIKTVCAGGEPAGRNTEVLCPVIFQFCSFLQDLRQINLVPSRKWSRALAACLPPPWQGTASRPSCSARRLTEPPEEVRPPACAGGDGRAAVGAGARARQPVGPAASVKGALLSLVTRSLAGSLARCGRSPPEEAVCLGCQEPENGSAPSGDIAEDPGFPRQLKTSIWFWLPADIQRPERTGGGTDRRTARWSARTREDRRRRLSTASLAAELEEKQTARPSCPAGCPRAEE
nr:uncharacterized protein LOC110553688 [Meriones unguiculatus]